MRIHEFRTELWWPRPSEEVFEFFADPANLDAITPTWLSFPTITPGPIDMRVDAMLDYKLRIRGIPIRWRSKITAWEPPYRFVDEQVRGPYRVWIHEHAFEPSNQGTLVRDNVHYAVPFDLLFHKLLVQPDVKRIFDYRAKCLHRQFG